MVGQSKAERETGKNRWEEVHLEDSMVSMDMEKGSYL